MTEYGTGIDLDENVDLPISSSGDIELVDGPAELQKDLGYNLKQALEDFIAPPLQRSQRVDAQALAEGVVADDPRIEDIQSVSVSESEDVTNQLDIEIVAITEDGPIESVVTV